MLTPSIFGENLFDEWMDDPWEKDFFSWPQWMLPSMKAFDKEPQIDKMLYGKHAKNMMKTDVKETENAYEVDMDLPGFKKDEVTADLQDGYLTISAAKGLDKDEKDQKSGKYIRKERYAGSMSRSFYVGDTYTKEDIHAKFEDGILRLTFPKKEEKKAIESPTRIAIEG